jgi:hypothetical protein
VSIAALNIDNFDIKLRNISFVKDNALPEPVETGTRGNGMQSAAYKPTKTYQLVLAWGFAGIPLLAGVIQTLINATKLFQ